MPLTAVIVGSLPGLQSWADVLEFAAVMGVVLGILGALSRAAWQKYTPRGFGYLCLAIVGMGAMGSAAFFATDPSSAERRTVDGRCYGIREIRLGRGATNYAFELLLNNGQALKLQTPISSRWFSEIEDGTSLRVTYLDETKPLFDFPRAIAVTVLSGDYRGRRRSVDANWLGAWLLAPFGIGVALASVFGAILNRRIDADPDHKGDDEIGGRRGEDLTDLGLE